MNIATVPTSTYLEKSQENSRGDPACLHVEQSCQPRPAVANAVWILWQGRLHDGGVQRNKPTHALKVIVFGLHGVVGKLLPILGRDQKLWPVCDGMLVVDRVRGRTRVCAHSARFLTRHTSIHSPVHPTFLSTWECTVAARMGTHREVAPK